MQDHGPSYFWAGPRADVRAVKAARNAYRREWCRRNWPQCLGMACFVLTVVMVAYVTIAMICGVMP